VVENINVGDTVAYLSSNIQYVVKELVHGSNGHVYVRISTTDGANSSIITNIKYVSKKDGAAKNDVSSIKPGDILTNKYVGGKWTVLSPPDKDGFVSLVKAQTKHVSEYTGLYNIKCFEKIKAWAWTTPM